MILNISANSLCIHFKWITYNFVIKNLSKLQLHAKMIPRQSPSLKC